MITGLRHQKCHWLIVACFGYQLTHDLWLMTHLTAVIGPECFTMHDFWRLLLYDIALFMIMLFS